MIKKTSDYFGELTFDKKVMREKLNKDAFEKMMATLESGEPLDQSIAADVAHALKEWAIQHGATHFTHWFQPQRGGTAEKHDAFICYDEQQQIIERFSAKLLIQSEPDASSFPSGGIRSTFEARGYTAWDPTSPVFLMESGLSNTLVIPSVYLSWTGDVLDMKTPFLRSQKALNDAVIRLQKILGNRFAKRVRTFLGLEQEFFLVAKEYYQTRPDLKNCGRTIFGAAPEKGQQISDHYFGVIRKKILEFMTDLDHELYRHGIPVKTRHNEVSPNQFEIAPLYEEANLAIDHNLQTMEMIARVADKYGLIALMQEKPFAGLNGSGKHMNWSLADNTGANYLEPSKSPLKNINFLMTIGAILLGVNEFGGLLRASVAHVGNDYRLGAHEAPPAVMSVYLGTYLNELFDQIEGIGTMNEKNMEHIYLDIQKLPRVDKDVSDRNRTSPIAFTGNKFEFRAVGANQNCSESASVFNLITAYGFNEICNRLEERKDSIKQNAVLILKDILAETKRVRFEGNNYSSDWEKEAEMRGLPNAKNTPAALQAYLDKKVIKLYEENRVLSNKELISKVTIKLENYCQTKILEYKTAINMTNTLFIPATLRYLKEMSETANQLQTLAMNCETIVSEIKTLHRLYHAMKTSAIRLKDIVKTANGLTDFQEMSSLLSLKAEVEMKELRDSVDKAERLIADDIWPVAKYRELLAEL
jgi:glutamine synthetase